MNDEIDCQGCDGDGTVSEDVWSYSDGGHVSVTSACRDCEGRGRVAYNSYDDTITDAPAYGSRGMTT